LAFAPPAGQTAQSERQIQSSTSKSMILVPLSI
jgi:hypothetical protein